MTEQRLKTDQIPELDPESMEVVSGDLIGAKVADGGGVVKGPYGIEMLLAVDSGLAVDSYGLYAMVDGVTTYIDGSGNIAASTGNQGFQGFQGDSGVNGVPGSNGAQGFQGFQGLQGLPSNPYWQADP